MVRTAAFLFAAAALAAQPLPPEIRTDWRGDVDGFLNEQARLTLAMAAEVLDRHPPAIKEPEKRRMALMLIDNVLHDELAPHRSAVHGFLHRQVGRAVEEIRTTEVTEGAMIWKLYNHGFVVKTPAVTLGFDIVTSRNIRNRVLPRIDGEVRRGIEGFTLPEDMMRKLIDEVDVLFVSHRHLDHADDWVAARFLDQNKPVLAPPEVWEDEPIHSRVLQLERRAHALQKVRLPRKGSTLDVVVYPGHQGRVQNNVYVVYTPEGMVFAHTGDQHLEEDFEWIDRVGEHHLVNVLMAHCDHYIERLARGFRPGLVIPGHENELGHPVPTRHPYWASYRKLEDYPGPWLHLVWGERYHYLPRRVGAGNDE